MHNNKCTLLTIRSTRALRLVLAGLTLGGIATSVARAAIDGKIHVLTVTGDGKSQEGYQDQWMAKPGQPNHTLYRGRFIGYAVTIR